MFRHKKNWWSVCW